ncbi:hypothetical protein HYPSUDRAFT_151570, partial [Hypholoma sublateritium FD-334 SS-4]
TSASILGGGVRAPRITTNNSIRCVPMSLAFFAIYGVIIGIVYSANLAPLASAKLYTPQNCLTGFALFWGGLTVGACNLLCGICVGTSGSPATLSDAADPDLVVKILVVEVFGTILGLFRLTVVRS